MPRDDSILSPKVDEGATAHPADSASAQPDLSRTGAAIESRRARSLDLTVLTVLAVLYTLHFARDFLLPIIFALLLSFLLSPVVRWLARLHINPPLGAGLVVLGILASIGYGAFGLSGSVQTWAATAPATLATAQSKLAKIIRPIQRASKTAEQVADAAGAATATNNGRKPAEVVVQGPSLTSRIFGPALGERSSRCSNSFRISARWR